MDDKNLMENMLQLEKGVCDLYMHGTLESSDKDVRRVFNKALNDALCLQESIYGKMESKGWYSTEQVDNTKMTQAKQKFQG